MSLETSTFSEENINFFRLTKLLLDVGANVLREAFKSYYEPNDLDKYLSNRNTKAKIYNLVHPKRILTQAQYDVLYPPSAKPDLDKLDITLLSCLLRNLNAKKQATDIVWSHPQSSDQSIEADVCRIREIRNDFQGHSSSAAMSNKEFEDMTLNITTLMTRMARTIKPTGSFEQEIQDKISSILNDKIDPGQISEMESKLDRMKDELQWWYNMDIPEKLETIYEKIDTVKKELQGEVEDVQNKFEWQQSRDPATVISTDQDRMNKNIWQTTEHIRQHARVHDLVNVETAAYQKAKQILMEKRKIILTGLPGSGKTFIGLGLTHDLCKEGSTIKPLLINTVNEWSLVDPRENLCVFVDDFCGKHEASASELKGWDRILSTIVGVNTYLVLTIRSNLLNSVTQSQQLNADVLEYYFCKEVLIDLSGEDKLSLEEKSLMLSKYLEKNHIVLDSQAKKTIFQTKEIIGFPQSCKMLRETDFSDKNVKVFTQPENMLLQEMDALRSNAREQYALLILVLTFGGSLSLADLDRETPKVSEVLDIFGVKHRCLDQIKDKICQLCSTFLTQEDVDVFHFTHDFVHEVTFKSFAKRHLVKCLNLAPLKLISKLCIGKVMPAASDKSSYCLVPESEFKTIYCRFQNAMAEKQPDVYTYVTEAKMWEAQEYLDGFFRLYETKEEQMQLVLSMDSNNESLLIHAARCGNSRLLEKTIKMINLLGVTLEKDVGIQLDTALQAACFSKETKLVEFLLAVIARPSNEAMAKAAEAGNTAVMEMLLEKGGAIDCEVPGKFGKTLLHHACVNCSIEMVMYLLNKKRSMASIPDDEGRMPLLLACIGGSLDIVKHLLELGAEVDCTGPEDESVFHIACFNGKSDIMKFFIENYLQLLFAVDHANRTPLHYAAWGGDISIFQFLLGYKELDVHARDCHGYNMLHLACRGGRISMVQYLVQKYPYMLSEEGIGKINALHWAAHSGSLDVLNILIEERFQYNCTDASGNNILHFACCNGMDKLVRSCTERFPDLLHQQNTYGDSLVHLASEGGNMSLFKYLQNLGLNIYSQGSSGRTILHNACEGGRQAVVEHILNDCEDMIEVVTPDGMTVLHSAVRGGNTRVFDMIKERRRVDPMQKTKAGQNLLHLAIKHGYAFHYSYFFQGSFHMVRHLTELYPSMISERDGSGLYPIHYAASGGNVKVLKYLIQNGANPMWKTRESEESLLDIAIRDNRLRMRSYLSYTYPQMIRMTLIEILYQRDRLQS